jgi:murein DD-endopeptidase MepM/ murein hydrolase activator NlpD
MVVGGQVIGVVAEGLTPENGWWKIPHLHFGIYVGPWRDSVLPGYKRFEEFRTKTKWWEDPSSFIEKYNQN